MYDAFSTKSGKIGFVVTFEDGSTMSEFDCTWDEVPKGRKIKCLALYNKASGTSVLELEGQGEYAFSNEAASAQNIEISKGLRSLFTPHDQQVLTAKLFYCKNVAGPWIEFRVDMLSTEPRAQIRYLQVDQMCLAKTTHRIGAGAT